MESSPEQLNTWDMADLSQLPADEFPDDVSGASGPGPVRRRKTSLRANPFASGPDSSLPRLRMQAFNAADMPLSPHTPLPRHSTVRNPLSRSPTRLSVLRHAYQRIERLTTPSTTRNLHAS